MHKSKQKESKKLSDALTDFGHGHLGLGITLFVFAALGAYAAFTATTLAVINKFTTSGSSIRSTTKADSPYLIAKENTKTTELDSPSGRVEGSTTPVFSSTFEKSGDWKFSDKLKTTSGIITYAGKGQTNLHLTKKKFSQTNTYVVEFIPISPNPDLVLRVENSFDIRFGDGGPWESSLYKFTRSGNWPPVPLQNPNTRRNKRWKHPCALIPGNLVKAIINVTATGEFRKNVTLQYEYQCITGRNISPQDAEYEPAIWSFTVPQSTNVPAAFGVGLNDPTGNVVADHV
jgi:hypothetical protein